jgi:hypothetical protein
MVQMGGGGSADAGDGVTSVSQLNEHQFPAWSTVLLLAMMELQIFRRLYECSHVFSYSSLARMHLAGYLVGLIFYPAASMTLFTQHFQDKQYVSALWTFMLRRLALPCLHHSLPSVLNPQISLLEYLKCMRGLQWFQLIGLAVFFLGWTQQYRCHMLLVSVYSLVAIRIISHQHLMSCFLMGSPHLIRPASALAAGQNSSHRCKIFPIVSHTLQYPHVV